MSEKQNREQPTREEVCGVLKKCEDKYRRGILAKASKLSAEDRLTLIEYFEIEPKDLASKIVLFWMQVDRGRGYITGGDIDEFASEPI